MVFENHRVQKNVAKFRMWDLFGIKKSKDENP